MNRKLRLDLDSITVTTFETFETANPNAKAVATQTTAAQCCGCNGTRLTCSSALC